MNGRLRKIIRQDAKQALSGKWLTAIGICFLLVLVTSPGLFSFHWQGRQFSFGGNGLGLLMVFVSAPLMMGSVKWYLSALRREETAIEEVFSWFTKETFLPSLLVRLFFIMVRVIQGIVITIIGILALIPLILAARLPFYFDAVPWGRPWGGFDISPYDLPYYFFNSPRFGARFFLLFGLLVLVAFAVVAITEWFIARFAAVPNIVADNPKIGIGNAIRQSVDVMQGNGWKLIRFYLSFIGWALLIPVTLGLILLYLAPYFTAARLLCIEYFRDTYEKKKQAPPPFEAGPENI